VAVELTEIVGVAPNPVGRPPMPFDQAVADSICWHLANGVTMTKISKMAGMPCFGTIYKWEETYPEFAAQARRARQIGTHYLAHEAIDISDDGSQDTILVTGKDGQEREVFNAEFAARSRLRVDTRLRIIGQWNRKDYGEKKAVEVSGPDGAPIQTITAQMTPQEAAEAYADSLREEPKG